MFQETPRMPLPRSLNVGGRLGCKVPAHRVSMSRVPLRGHTQTRHLQAPLSVGDADGVEPK